MWPLAQPSSALCPIISAALVVPGVRERQTNDSQLLANASLCGALPDVHHRELLLWVWGKDLLLREPEERNSVLSRVEAAPFAVL